MLFTKHVIFVVISVLVIALIYSSFSSFNVYALPPDQGWVGSGTCGAATTDPRDGREKLTCCWSEAGSGQGHIRLRVSVNYCQTCTTGVVQDCGPKQRQGALGETPTSPPTGPAAPLQDGGVLLQPTPPPTSSVAPLASGGVLQQSTTTPTPPPLFGRNIPQLGGVFEQPATTTAIAPPTPVLTPVPPVLTPEPPVPMFGSTQQQAAPTPAPTGDGGLTGVAPSAGEAAPLTDRGSTSCPVGNVWDPNLMICVPDLPPPPQLCPDGSIPQSTGPGGIRPECPSFKAEQPEIQEPNEPEDEGQEEPDEGQDTTTAPLT